MEAELDRVEEGELQWQTVLHDFYGPFRRRLTEGADRGVEIVRDTVSADAGPCPKCGRELAVRWNRYGRFLGCTGYPECRHTQSLEGEQKKEPKPIGESCPKCGAQMVEREGRFGPFIACSNYPTCKHTRPRTIAGLTCPKCGEGDIGEKRTRRGKPFWGCTRYPECDWSSWDEPVARACPNCTATFMVRRNTKARGEFLRCPTCAYEYTIGADGELEPAGIGVPAAARRERGSAAAKKFPMKTSITKAAASKAPAKTPASKKAGAVKKLAAVKKKAKAGAANRSATPGDGE
jgi:DNA topoisomerase-1